MTTIHTASYKAYRPDMGQALVCSRGLPRWRMTEAATWPRCWLLTPTGAYIDAEPDEFRRQYLAQLTRHGAAKITAALESIADEYEADNIVGLCFEASPADCHRGLWAQWALESAGLKVTEIE